MIMNSDIIIISIVAMVLVYTGFLAYLKNKKEMHMESIKAKDKELDLSYSNLYVKIDPDLIEEEIDKYVNAYIADYVKYNFIINRVNFIPPDHIDKMVKDIIKTIMVEIPDLYVFYINMRVSIKTENDLLKYITGKVRELVLNVVTEYNKPIE